MKTKEKRKQSNKDKKGHAINNFNPHFAKLTRISH